MDVDVDVSDVLVSGMILKKLEKGTKVWYEGMEVRYGE